MTIYRWNQAQSAQGYDAAGEGWRSSTYAFSIRRRKRHGKSMGGAGLALVVGNLGGGRDSTVVHLL
jgi:hypothetical protein